MNVVKIRQIKSQHLEPTALADESAVEPSTNTLPGEQENRQAVLPTLKRVDLTLPIQDDAGSDSPIESKKSPAREPIESLLNTEQIKPWITLGRIGLLTIKSCLMALFLALRTSIRYLIRHPFHAILISVLLALLGLVIITGSEIHNQMIMGKISDQTIDRIIEGSRFSRPFDAEAINKSGPQELLRVGAPVWIQREGVRAILYHARKSGLAIEDQAVLLAIADIESGFNPIARAPTTTACGLFQFVKKTGEIFGLPHTDCMDPMANAHAQISHYQYNFERRVRPFVEQLAGPERVFRTFELSYYLHHDGPDSRNPSNDLKATVLNGTQVLFKAYHALLEESESQTRAPTFTEQFYANLLKFLDSTRSILLARLGTSKPSPKVPEEIPAEGIAIINTANNDPIGKS